MIFTHMKHARRSTLLSALIIIFEMHKKGETNKIQLELVAELLIKIK